MSFIEFELFLSRVPTRCPCVPNSHTFLFTIAITSNLSYVMSIQVKQCITCKEATVCVECLRSLEPEARQRLQETLDFHEEVLWREGCVSSTARFSRGLCFYDICLHHHLHGLTFIASVVVLTTVILLIMNHNENEK
jgi:hypothetical protein